MNIGLLTMFRTLRPSYSLVHVVENQIKVLLDRGNNVKLFVSESCKEEERYGSYLDARLEWIKITNTVEGEAIIWHNYAEPEQELHNGFEKEVEVIAKDLEVKLKGIQVCIVHDILYQGMHYLHNCAVRKAQKYLPEIGFIAFTHSFPVIRPKVLNEYSLGRFIPMPNTLYVFPTQAGISALAKQYNVPEGKCRVVYHTAPLIGDMSELVVNISQTHQLLAADILIVYPARLTIGKKLDKVAALAGTLKTLSNKSIKIIFCDSTSRDTDAPKYKTFVRFTGEEYGLDKEDIVFTSDEGYEEGIPRESVLELFALSNLYICPSASEAFGLTVVEAARQGNLLVLNENVPALKEIGKQLGAYFMQWDARVEDIIEQAHYLVPEPTYYGKHAKELLRLLENNPVLKAKTKIRQQFNNEWIWKNQLEPLLEEAKNIPIKEVFL